MTVLIYIHERDIAAYHQQGWICWRLLGHHGARLAAKNYIGLMEFA